MPTPDAPQPVPCESCKGRTVAWLVEHTEAWHGPKAGWKKAIRNRFFEDLALLNLFAEDFHFPPNPDTTPDHDPRPED